MNSPTNRFGLSVIVGNPTDIGWCNQMSITASFFWRSQLTDRTTWKYLLEWGDTEDYSEVNKWSARCRFEIILRCLVVRVWYRLNKIYYWYNQHYLCQIQPLIMVIFFNNLCLPVIIRESIKHLNFFKRWHDSYTNSCRKQRQKDLASPNTRRRNSHQLAVHSFNIIRWRRIWLPQNWWWSPEIKCAWI